MCVFWIFFCTSPHGSCHTWCKYVFVFVCVCVCARACVCECVCVSVWVCMHVCVCVCVRMRACVYVRVWVCVCVHMCMCVRKCACAWECVHFWMCVCLLLFVQTLWRSGGIDGEDETEQYDTQVRVSTVFLMCFHHETELLRVFVFRLVSRTLHWCSMLSPSLSRTRSLFHSLVSSLSHRSLFCYM